MVGPRQPRLVRRLWLSRNFCQRSVTLNFCNFYTVLIFTGFSSNCLAFWNISWISRKNYFVSLVLPFVKTFRNFCLWWAFLNYLNYLEYACFSKMWRIFWNTAHTIPMLEKLLNRSWLTNFFENFLSTFELRSPLRSADFDDDFWPNWNTKFFHTTLKAHN